MARRRAWKSVLSLLLLAGGAALGFQRLRPLPKASAGNAARGEWAFWHSDLGSAAYGSIPVALFDALPTLFPELFPEGWETFGLLTADPAKPAGPPVGLVRTSWMGLPLYGTNCALCHVGRFQGRLVAGLPNTELDLQAMMAALRKALADPRLKMDAIARVARERGHPLGLYDRVAVRLWIAASQRMLKRYPVHTEEVIGAGRSDALNAWKRGLGLNASVHSTMVDIPPLFNQALKRRTLYDGSVSGDMAARVMLTEVRKGRSARSALLNRAVFDDIVAYIDEQLVPPRYPYPLDAAKTQRGHEVFKERCSGCHGTYAPDAPSYPNLRVDVAKVGTDDNRALSMTPDMVEALSRYEFRDYLTIEPAAAYMPPPLNGVWMTAPYFHNGSVPTLWHLLHGEELRPVVFYRHDNAYDFVRVGLACAETTVDGVLTCPPDASQRKHLAQTLFRFDARVRGNSNAGHPFGRSLPEPDKDALIEYLKSI